MWIISPSAQEVEISSFYYYHFFFVIFRDSLNKTVILILEDARKDRDSRVSIQLFSNECQNKQTNTQRVRK